jgi:hypothetical protein
MFVCLFYIFKGKLRLSQFIQEWQFKDVLNIHSLWHLMDYVTIHGPLWTMWAFAFEDKLQFLRSHKHAKRKPEGQMSFAASFLSALPAALYRVSSSLQLSTEEKKVVAFHNALCFFF